MSARESSMHVGTITVLVALLVIPLAILGLLTFNTASAEQTVAQKHADATAESYELETCGQTFVAGVDDTLARVRSAGGQDQAGVAAVERDLQKIAGTAAAAAGGDVAVNVDAEPTGTGASAVFSTPDGQQLSIEISVTSAADYTVDVWTTSTAREPAPGDTLWTEGS
jgi:predicted enzyme related to lactoylglutathione lyase